MEGKRARLLEEVQQHRTDLQPEEDLAGFVLFFSSFPFSISFFFQEIVVGKKKKNQVLKNCAILANELRKWRDRILTPTKEEFK